MILPALLLLSTAAGATACGRPPAEADRGAQAGTAQAGLELPRTRAGAAACAFLDAFHSNDPERMRAFVQKFAAPHPERSLEESVQSYRSPYEHTGSLRILSIDRSTDTELVLRAHSALLGELYLIFIVDRQPPHRLEGIYFEPPER
jgi:hypothetical protein